MTNITHEHLDLHGTREAYRAAKGRLFEMAAQHVLNADDVYSFEYLEPDQSRKANGVFPEVCMRRSRGRKIYAQSVTHTPTEMTLYRQHRPGGVSGAQQLDR